MKQISGKWKGAAFLLVLSAVLLLAEADRCLQHLQNAK